ncbi:MAG: hypothetical protein E6J85_15655 [Deltaproteobacteria bacterium]|nr:MAG: hypothetical protein E6J85_15655 [Deltaproteobacteria bacterium]TMB31791.1 MAG: hypothetical protein E6J61_08930 [Deltaproteobacteria bacterium]
MIAAPAVLCALLAQALPPAPPPPPRPPERLHIPRVHVPRIEIPEFDVDLDDWDFPGVDLSGLRAEMEKMHDDLSRTGKDLDGHQGWFVARANPRDDDDEDDDDDQAQEERDRAREERERAREERQRQREQVEKMREKQREQAEKIREQQREQAEKIREQAREQKERMREQQEQMREQQDRAREQSDRRRFRFNWNFNDQDDEDEDTDDSAPSARAKGKNGVATLPAKGPVTVRIRAQSGEVQVVATDRAQVSASLSEVPSRDDVQLSQSGDRVDVQVGSHRALRRGKLRVEVPKGSSVDFESTSADLQVQGIGGDVRIQTMSGDIKVAGVRKANVETISGDVKVDANGPIRVHTVSGNAVASTADPGVRLEFESASGNLDWTGACGKGCHVSTETVSGQIAIAVDSSRSSFELSYSSHSGDFRNDLNLDVKHAPKKKHGGVGGWLEAVYGKGEGIIECDAFSGDLQIRKK